MEKLESKYKGLKTAFKKLKERELLTIEDILPLQQFVDATVICTTDVEELKRLLRPESEFHDIEKILCDGDCDPRQCDACAEQCAKLVRKRVLEVNTHHHTKTCAKKGPDCRFNIPRPPSNFTIIAQAMSDKVKKTEAETVKAIEYIEKKVKAELKMIEDDLNARRKESNEQAEIEGTLEDMLWKLFPQIRITDDEEFICIKDEEKEYKLKTSLVKQTWEQNPCQD